MLAMANIRSQGERESGTHSSPNFEEKMEELQKAILAKNWPSFKSFFQNDPKAILEPLDLYGNTAVHVTATRWNKPELITELLNILPEVADRWRALRKGNAHKNTVLHQVIHCKNLIMVDAVLAHGKQLRVPEDEDGEDKDLPLMELVNDLGETPVYMAAKYGKLNMLKHMAKLVGIKNHLYRRQRREDAAPDRTSILRIAIMGQRFEVALWLIMNMEGIDEVARAKDENDLTCLQLLSGMPSVFRSYDSHMGFADKLIYACVPVKQYDESSTDDNYDDSTHLRRRQHMKSVAATALQTILWIVLATVFIIAQSSLSDLAIILAIAIPPVLIKGSKELARIKKIKNKKRQHKLAEKLADLLVERDKSWMYSTDAKPQKEVVLPMTQLSEVASRKKAKARQDNEKGQYTPLLLAASTGIVEIVKKIIDLHPEAIYHVNHDGLNILHVTVKHRQKKIYKLLKKYGALKSLAARVSDKGCTLLHHAAMMDHYDGRNQASVVFQLEEELRWFERVKKITPRSFVLYRNGDKLTAGDLFELEHSDMLNEAQAWIKGTAQSCSAVAVLVATVAFPVAAPPPKADEKRSSILVIIDAVALTTSLMSVVMFLSILTSSFQMQDFKQRLPLKLSNGFALLFLSLMATMLTFVSAILLGLSDEKQVISVLICSIMVIPIFFGLTQYSIFMAVKYKMRELWKALKEIVPKRFIILTKCCTKERVYPKYL